MGWTGGGRGYNLRVETVRKQPQPDASIVYLTFSARLSPTRNLYLGKNCSAVSKRNSSEPTKS